MDQAGQERQKEQIYEAQLNSNRKNHTQALIAWGVLLAVTIAIDILHKRVEMEYLIAQGYLEGGRFWWRSWLIAGGIAIVTFLVPYHRIYNWLKKIFHNHIRSEEFSLKEFCVIGGGMTLYGVLLYLISYFETGNKWDIPLFIAILIVVFGSMVVTACINNVGWQLFYNFIIIAAVWVVITLSMVIGNAQEQVAFEGIVAISLAVIQLFYRVGSDVSIRRRVGEAVLFAMEPILITNIGLYILGGSAGTIHRWNILQIAVQTPTLCGWLLLAAEPVLAVVLVWLTVWIGRLGFEQGLVAIVLTILILFFHLLQVISVIGNYEVGIYAPMSGISQSSAIFLMLYLRLITGEIWKRPKRVKGE